MTERLMESAIDLATDEELHRAHEHAKSMVLLTFLELRRRGYQEPGVPFTGRPVTEEGERP